MRQKLRSPWQDLDVDEVPAPAVALRVDVGATKAEISEHRHRKGQLVFALKGGVTCRVPGGLWMVPPHCAVWVPGAMPHSNRATANARLFFVYIEPSAIRLPARCCTLSISPLLRELIIDLADQVTDDQGTDDQAAQDDARHALLTRLLLRDLASMPLQQLHLPLSPEKRLQRIAAALAKDPADRRTLSDWADYVALSDSSLARLIAKETGLTFGRWRQQLHLIVALRELTAGASVQQVAGDLGYESVTAFITMFKKALGKPPAKYLASIAQDSIAG